MDVHMPGGAISIEISGDGHVHMTGPVAGIAHGEFHYDMLKSVLKKVDKKP